MKNIAMVASLLLAACGGRAQNTSPAVAPVFPRVELPTMITEPQAQADYVVQHYWDRFDFTDTAFLSWPEALEQQFVDYIAILPYVGVGLARQSLSALMTRAQADTAMYRFFTERTEHYLWDPNSPYRNDEFYLPVLENLIAYPALDAGTLARSRYRLDMALKNRPGTVAADFEYTLPAGQTRRVSQLASEYLLLFFNNPGCHTCLEIMTQTQQSPLLSRLLADKRLTILAVYADEDLAAWREYLPQMPTGAGWIVSYDKDQTVRGQNLYDLKAVPTLYLLDVDKKVVLKDAYIEQVEAWLQQHVLQGAE